MVIVCRSVSGCSDLLISPGSSEKPVYFDEDDHVENVSEIVRIMNVNIQLARYSFQIGLTTIRMDTKTCYIYERKMHNPVEFLRRV